MKIKESKLREIIREEIVNQMPEDNFDNNGIEWSEEEEDEEGQIIDMLMNLCAEGEKSFKEMYRELTNNPYIIENPEKFEALSSKIKALCSEIENIWLEDTN